MDEQKIAARVHRALGEHPAPGPALERLRAAVQSATAGRGLDAERNRRGPRGLSLLAACLAVALVAGLLVLRAERQRPAQPPTRPGQHATLPAPTSTCQANTMAPLILVDRANQRLTAYQDGCPFLTTAVTTGRPSLPTPAGRYQILMKAATFTLVSPYPPGSPNWFPNTEVHDYMALDATGVALHSAEWEPDSEFGIPPATNPYASEGTIHVPLLMLQRLYAWAPVGTIVEVR